jgi:hypothetical protein
MILYHQRCQAVKKEEERERKKGEETNRATTHDLRVLGQRDPRRPVTIGNELISKSKKTEASGEETDQGNYDKFPWS